MSLFERYLTVWVSPCIVVGAALGRLVPSIFDAVAGAEVARANLPARSIVSVVWIVNRSKGWYERESAVHPSSEPINVRP